MSVFLTPASARSAARSLVAPPNAARLLSSAVLRCSSSGSARRDDPSTALRRIAAILGRVQHLSSGPRRSSRACVVSLTLSAKPPPPLQVPDVFGNRRRRLEQGEYLPPYAIRWQKMRPGPQRERRHLLGPKRAEAPRTDIFLALRINPLHEPMNAGLLTPFMTSTGGVKSRRETRLGRESQRKVGKAIRRAQAMGLLSYSNNRAVMEPEPRAGAA